MALGNIPAGWVQSPGGLIAPPYPPAVVDLLTQIQRGVYGGSGGLFGTGIPSANMMGNPSINPQFPQTDMPVGLGQRVQLLNNHRAPYGTIVPNLPYAQDTPLTDEILAARQRQGNLGVRGVLRNSGPGYMSPTGYPRQVALPAAAGPAGQGYATPLLTQVQQGVYGGNPSAISANVIPEATPSSIPPGAGRGAGAANMPYAQWQQASDDLVNSVARQGPYAGTRGWGRASGPAYMADTGYPRQVALPQYAESLRIPNQTGLAGAVNDVPVARPSSIPQGAGRGTGIGNMPYGDEAIPMGPVYEAPTRQSTLRNSLRNGTQTGEGMSFNRPAASALANSVEAMDTSPAGLLRNSGIDPVTLQGQHATPNAGWSEPLPVDHPAMLAESVTPGTSRGNFLTRNSSWLGAERGAAAETPSLARNFARGLMGRPALGIEGAKPSLMNRAAGSAGRGAVVMGVPIVAGMAADRLGQDTIGGQFAQGYALGGGFGGMAGLPGSIVGGLGVGLGNVGANAVSGRGIESLWGGGDNGPQGVMKDYLANQQVLDPTTGEQVYSPQAQVVMGLLDPEINVMAQMGIPDDQAQAMQERFNSKLAATNSQEERINIVKDAADEILGMVEEPTSQGQMSPSDIASMQIMASQMMAPIAADSVALGNMQADALQGLMPSLPEAYQQPVQSMINQAVPRSQRVANAYIQQAYAMPQLDVLQGYQNQVNQTAQQLTAQALSNQMTGGGGGGDLASLIASAGGNSGDIVSALAGG